MLRSNPDLRDAVNALPAATFYNNGNRITKYAAAMVLTSVYMQQGKYADAASAGKDCDRFSARFGQPIMT